jgi:nucleotide-binding universal stress UspA family protein
MLTITRILCPVDFSEPSTHAAEHAAVLAGWYGSSITALHVFSPVFAPVRGADAVRYRGEARPDDREVEGLKEAAKGCLHAALAAGVPVDVLVRTGQPVNGILEAASSLPADLIVMGTHGASGFEHLVLGSVAEKVLRKAACPVLTVPPRAAATSRLPFKRILCAVDFSECSLSALAFGLSLAKESDAALTLLHVVEWPWEEPPAPPLAELPPTEGLRLNEFRKHREAESRSRLEALVPPDARDWCTPTVRVTHGKPYVEVLRVAAEESADVIVIGVRGRQVMDLTLFGSTANQLVRRATCPVLTIRR